MRVRLKILASFLLFNLTISLVCVTAQTEKMGTTVPTGIIPVGVAVDPSLNRTYIMGDGVLGILDGATNSLTTVETGIVTWPFPVDGFKEVIAVNPMNHRVYLLGASELGIFDGVTQMLTHRLPLGVYRPVYVAVNPATDTIYIAAFNSLVIVDGETLSISTVELPDIRGTFGVACNAETNQIYVPSQSSLLVIDGAMVQVPVRIELGSVDVYGIAINPTTNKVYLPAKTTPNNRFILIVVDGVTLEVNHYPINQYPLDLNEVYVGPFLIFDPQDIALDPASDRIYMPAFVFPVQRRVLVEIDGKTNHFKRILPVVFDDKRFVFTAVNPDSGLAYLTGPFSVLIIQVNPVGGEANDYAD